MNTLRGSRSPTPDAARDARSSRALILSIAFHVIVVVVLARVLISPTSFWIVFGRQDTAEIPAERISFLRLPRASGEPVAGRSGGDGRPLPATPPARLVAPTEVPAAIPDLPPVSNPEPETGSGPLVGAGGPAQGIRPTYTGPRVWTAPGEIVSAPKSAKEKLDSAIVSIISPFNDSIAARAGAKSPTDWTVKGPGGKWGIDPQYIRLGKLSIPTAVLGLLPINQGGGNPAYDRNRLQNQLHAEIFWQAQRGMNEADFKKAVRSIRERKERERAASGKNETRQPEQQPAASSSQR
jgi:hypothetical protein